LIYCLAAAAAILGPILSNCYNCETGVYIPYYCG